MEDKIADVARRRGEFRAEAYFFTLDALHTSVEELSVRRHLSGPELLQGVVRLANERFGGEANEILNGWGVSCTRDFGVIIYDLIDAGILSKTEDDELEDFDEVFDLSDALKEESWRQRWRVGDSPGYGGSGGRIL
jgi:uncharacterized repeat protein (TIGR04138 family)